MQFGTSNLCTLALRTGQKSLQQVIAAPLSHLKPSTKILLSKRLWMAQLHTNASVDRHNDPEYMRDKG